MLGDIWVLTSRNLLRYSFRMMEVVNKKTIFDLQGKLVVKSQCIDTVIDLNTLVFRDGIYLIVISDGKTSIGKIVALNKQM